jgi:hypothetical protein
MSFSLFALLVLIVIRVQYVLLQVLLVNEVIHMKFALQRIVDRLASLAICCIEGPEVLDDGL